MAVKNEEESRACQLKELIAKKNAGDKQACGELFKIVMDAAKQAATRSYSPYSHYPVGAALLTRDGRIFSGCNVENASYGGTICAERTAIVKAVSEGFKEFDLIAVFCAKAKDGWPCGFCRQFISEFGSGIDVICEGADGQIQVLKISELLPRMFGPGALGIEIS